jgi:hypothetical protein
MIARPRHGRVPAAQAEEYAERPNPGFAIYGPRTRREFADLFKASGGQP